MDALIKEVFEFVVLRNNSLVMILVEMENSDVGRIAQSMEV